MGKGGLDWALRSELWKGKFFQDHTIVIDTELEETLEAFIHLITTSEAFTVQQALWQAQGYSCCPGADISVKRQIMSKKTELARPVISDTKTKGCV